MIAIRAYNMLANGMGGIDWTGVPIVFGLLGITDPESAIDRICVVKLHQPPRTD